NLDILRRYIADESVGLVYLDPPFNSNATYNILFAEQNGSRAAAQIKADAMTTRTNTNELILPVVHMNGTSKKELLEQREAVYRALRNVEKALCQMAPNGRDYYVVPGSILQAQAQHERRLAAIAGLMDEMTKEADGIYKQGR
ncbi:MAG TPA: hypothetical protein VLM89_07795, partial [Phycisphaerae bacterium]|nr:hypothetical protein [Phycisphaerae bacterium]